MHVIPTRFMNAPALQERFGTLLDRLAPALLRSDPSGDAAVAALSRDGWSGLDAALRGEGGAEALRALVDEASAVPAWVDRERIERGGRVFLRTGAVGGLVLGARSLVAGYCSPAGNKPLVRTGALQRDGQRRLAETGRFVAEVHRRSGLEPGNAGWTICLKVRLMHAQVRALLLRRGDWPTADWGAPLNQHDLVATSMLFSVVWIEGVQSLGIHVSPSEAEDHLHLWRWASALLGVEDQLFPCDMAEGLAISEAIFATQQPPDDDARALVRALLHPPGAKGPGGLGEGLCRSLMPEELADQLHLPRTAWRHAPRVARAVIRPLERVRRMSRRLDAQAVQAGAAYWERAVQMGLGEASARFEAPSTLVQGQKPHR